MSVPEIDNEDECDVLQSLHDVDEILCLEDLHLSDSKIHMRLGISWSVILTRSVQSSAASYDLSSSELGRSKQHLGGY